MDARLKLLLRSVLEQVIYVYIVVAALLQYIILLPQNIMVYDLLGKALCIYRAHCNKFSRQKLAQPQVKVKIKELHSVCNSLKNRPRRPLKTFKLTLNKQVR